jgi:glucarate dehydratase
MVRTIIEVETDNGLVGLGEVRGTGRATEQAFLGLRKYLVGHDPFDLEALRFKILNPTAALYNNRTSLHSAVEFACLDLIGKHLDVSLHKLLGGKLRDAVPFASYLFFRYPGSNGSGEVRTIEQLLREAERLRREHGFRTHKLKGGVFPPTYELEAFRALAAEVGSDRVRYDPNAVLSVEEGIRFGRAIEDLNNDYFEDPTWGLSGMRRVRESVGIPLATNTVIVNFEQLAANVRDPAVDIVLLDTTFWGGVRPCIKAAGICEAFQLGVAMHSSGELGIQLATMLHLGVTLPNLAFAADTHYHHLMDDVILGGKLEYVDGALAVPSGPGLGVSLDRAKVDRYAAYYEETGNYTYDRDPGRPGWFPLIPNDRWADPQADPPDFETIALG